MNNEAALKASQRKRLFFALWLDEAVIQQIKKNVIDNFSACEGRVLDSKNWHITLAYFGSADATVQTCLEQQVGKIISPPFELQLSQCGYWPRPKVAWLAPIEIPDALNHLTKELQHEIQSCGFKPEAREFQPHITLVRKAQKEPSVIEVKAINLKVSEFCLVESRTEATGAQYTVLKRWALTPFEDNL